MQDWMMWLAVGLLFVWLIVLRRKPTKDQSIKAERSTKRPVSSHHQRNAAKLKPRVTAKQNAENRRWYSIKLIPCGSACDSMSYMSQKVYLTKDAPQLPLPSCDNGLCSCRYEHLKDRRQDLRRDPYSQYGLLAESNSRADRRAGRGRRSTDRMTPAY